MSGETPPGGLDIGGMIRRVRRVCDLSQRDLAARMGVSKSTVNRWESEDGEPSLSQLQQLLALAGWSLSIGPDPRENNGVEPSPMRADAARDLQGRRYPAHLDVIGFDSWEVFRVRNPRSGPWRRSPRRETRDEQRRISGVVPDDHANDFELAQETRARREARDQKARDDWNRVCDAKVARGEPDPRIWPDCECIDECFELPGCAAACTCRCEIAIVHPDGRVERNQKAAS